MDIKGLQKTTLVDYPDKIACIVFLPGCNFRCPFCQNPDLIFNVKDLPTMPMEELMEFLEKRKNVLDGIVVTGGEPTLNKDLPEFIRRLKTTGLLIKLDTNGTNPEMLKLLLKEKIIDYIAMDIKSPMKKYDIATASSVDKTKIQQSIDIIKNSDIGYEFRTTVLPRLHTEDDIIQIAKELEGAKRFAIQQFRPLITLDPEFKNEEPYSEKKLREIGKKIEKHFGKVILRV